MKTEKLQKVIARNGVTSRRDAEEWIAAGRVSVNGRIVPIGTRVAENDIIRIDGRIMNQTVERDQTRILLYHKPEGEICSTVDAQGRTTVFNRLPQIRRGRWIAIGRLDVTTTGLLLFTTNGELANYLMHPKHAIARVYAVRVLGNVTEDILHNLTQGVELEDGPAQFAQIKLLGGEGANQWYEVTLHEGRNREVKRLWESQGLQVSRLTRVEYAGIKLPRFVSRGRWQELSKTEVETFLVACGFKRDPTAQSKLKSRQRPMSGAAPKDKKPRARAAAGKRRQRTPAPRKPS